MEVSETQRGRYYITRYFTSEDGPDPAEEMERGTEYTPVKLVREASPAYASGNAEEPIMIRLVEEEVSYMADYQVNDRQEIESVRFDPVTVAKEEKFWILNRKETFPDT